MSTVAWVGSVLAIQRLVTLREDIAELGYTPETWRSWKQLWFALRIFFAFAMLALFALLVAAAVAGDALKHALP
jgi:predicted ferric reductase